MALINGYSIRDFLISAFLTGTIVNEVYLFDTNQPDGLPDLSGVVIREIGGDFVRFGQVGSAGSANIVVAIKNIQAIETA